MGYIKTKLDVSVKYALKIYLYIFWIWNLYAYLGLFLACTFIPPKCIKSKASRLLGKQHEFITFLWVGRKWTQELAFPFSDRTLSWENKRISIIRSCENNAHPFDIQLIDSYRINKLWRLVVKSLKLHCTVAHWSRMKLSRSKSPKFKVVLRIKCQ